MTRERIKRFKNSEKHKEWVENNRGLLQKYSKEKFSNKTHLITKEEWLRCKEYFDNSCAYCGLHADNHYRMWKGELKKIDLHREHVNHDGSNEIDNCIPACQSCNSKKWKYKFEDWYNIDNEKYSIERYNKIMQWLEIDYKNT